MDSTDRAAHVGAQIIRDPAYFVRAIFRANPWSKQRDILTSVGRHPRNATRSGHAVGKTTVAAWVLLWFLSTKSPSKVISTAPTARQVTSILWAEVRKWIACAQSHGVRLFPPGALPPAAPSISIRDDWFALGLTTNEPERFQGFHGPNVLVIVDEAPGVPRPIWEGIEGIMAGGNACMLQIGNPTVRSGPFWDAFQSDAYAHFGISCYEHPNVINDDPDIVPGAVTRKWIEERKAAWGEDSPLFQSRVLGQFPDESPDSELPLSVLLAACVDVPPPDALAAPACMGIDVARYGQDLTVFLVMRGGWVVHLEAHSKRDLAFTRQRTLDLAGQFGIPPGNIYIDQTGLGAGVVDELAARKFGVVGVDFGASSSRPSRFVNLKAELQWTMARALRAKGLVLSAFPDRDRLLGDLSELRIHYTSKGLIAAEPKDAFRKRVGRSPDYMDALALAWHARRLEGDLPPLKDDATQGDILARGEELTRRLGIRF